MELARRFRWIALSLPVALAAAAVIGRPAPPGALASAPLSGRDCGHDARAGQVSGRAWYRVDALMDGRGTLMAQQLTAGRGRAQWTAELPPESFASGPVGGRVLVGDDDGRRSRLRVLDVASGCWTEVGTVTDVVRSAVLTADGTGLYEHRVDRGTRRDLGVWRRSLAPSGGAVEVLPGLGADIAYGPTYATSLLPVAEDRLVVSSCGERACRTRVVGPGSGTAAVVDGTGPVFGMADVGLIALEPCDGLACGLAEVDPSTGARRAIGVKTSRAAVAVGGGSMVVVSGPYGLGVLPLGAGDGVRWVPGSAGLVPLVADSKADSGIETPEGRVAVAPAGRVVEPAAVQFLDPATLTLTTDEVLP